MQGPDSLGDEFEVEEDERSDPERIYDTLDVTEQVLTILSQAGEQLSMQVEGDDLIISVRVPAQTEGTVVENTMVVARSAFVEECRAIGLFEG